jgi:hypothetical protein
VLRTDVEVKSDGVSLCVPHSELPNSELNALNTDMGMLPWGFVKLCAGDCTRYKSSYDPIPVILDSKQNIYE